MSAITVTREVVFTDYDCREDARPAVSLSRRADGGLVALVLLTPGSIPHEETEPDMLRSLAACLMAAAEEMEGI